MASKDHAAQLEHPQMLHCPYCAHPNPPATGECSACGQEMPWLPEQRKLRDEDKRIWEEVKSRETSRLRATQTLIEETIDYARTGRPVSASAIRGLVNALLLPRAVMIAGSIVTGAVLIVQTVLIAWQGQLLRDQTAAATLDRIERVRARVAQKHQLQSALADIHERWGRHNIVVQCSGKCEEVQVAVFHWIAKQYKDTNEINYMSERRPDLSPVAVREGRPLSEAERTDIFQAGYIVQQTSSILAKEIQQWTDRAADAYESRNLRGQSGNADGKRLLELAALACMEPEASTEPLRIWNFLSNVSVSGTTPLEAVDAARFQISELRAALPNLEAIGGLKVGQFVKHVEASRMRLATFVSSMQSACARSRDSDLALLRSLEGGDKP